MELAPLEIEPMQADPDDPDLDLNLVLANWWLTLMNRAFGDLALSFATMDATAALSTILAIETMVAGELQMLAENPPPRIGKIPVDVLVMLARNFRDMTQGARQQIHGLAKPH